MAPLPLVQISIPTASTSTQTLTSSSSSSSSTVTKPYTQYHIHILHPLRTQILLKRYSEFLTLHNTLTSSLGSPPVSFPNKESWKTFLLFDNTVKDETWREERRKGLEAYLRGILETSDPKWRASQTFRDFCGLDRAGGEKSTEEDKRAGENVDPQTWLIAFRDVKGRIHLAKAAIRKREEGLKTANTNVNRSNGGKEDWNRKMVDVYATGADAKAEITRANAGIAKCEQSLEEMTRRPDVGSKERGWDDEIQLGDGEIRRRRDLLTNARKEIDALELQLKSTAGSDLRQESGGNMVVSPTMTDRQDLLGRSGVRAGRILGGGPKETEQTRELDNTGVLQLQKQIMHVQDQDVGELTQVVSRLKEMGVMMNEELVVQNEMLGIIDKDVDRVQGKIDIGKKRIAKIN